MFIYVFSKSDADELIGLGMTMISHDKRINVYTFERPEDMSVIKCPYTEGDLLTFPL